MKIFTISSGAVYTGATVEKLIIARNEGDIEVPAVFVGEEGTGRKRSLITVQLSKEQHAIWKEKGSVVVEFADLGVTKTGNPKLISKTDNDLSTDECVCVFRTKIGFRGSNGHTGDRNGMVEYEEYGVKKSNPTFDEFPGRVIAKGVIAQGDAGRMGSGDQLVAVMPKCVFRTTYGGRLYGAPSAHYYSWDGSILDGGLTWEERCASDLF